MVAKAGLTNNAGWYGTETNFLQKHILLSVAVSDRFFLGLPKYAVILLSIFVIMISFFFVTGSVRAFRVKSSMMVFSMFYIFSLLFYAIGDPTSIWSWYTVPTSIAFISVVFKEIIYQIDTSDSNSLMSKILKNGFIAVVVMISLFSIIFILPQRSNAINEGASRLSSIGKYVTEKFPDANSIMIGDIGILGYETDLNIIDIAGLVTPYFISSDKEEVVFYDIIKSSDVDIININGNLEDNFLPYELLCEKVFRDMDEMNEFLSEYRKIYSPEFKTNFYVKHDIID